MTPFDLALAQLYAFEGGFANNPLDRGGRTYRGITQSAYDNFRRRKQRTAQPVENASTAECDEFYREEYWDTAGCDQLPVQIAIAVFDMAVNSSPSAAKKTLQRALHVKDDGVIGPATIAAARSTPEVLLLFLEARGKFIAEILRARPSQVEFLGGWISRLLRQAWGTR